jgi:tetratricopeptide (TPR) repeat protein
MIRTPDSSLETCVAKAAHGIVVLTLLLLCACAAPPKVAPGPAALTSATPEQMVAAVRAAAGDGEGELAVQPLRDPQVEDLRQSATRLEAQQQYDDAAKALDDALAIVPDDPALLQERAEAALLLRDTAGAEKFALRAFELGSQVGPLCRRHWATVEQARLVAGDAAGAASAKQQAAGCKVAAPNRF